MQQFQTKKNLDTFFGSLIAEFPLVKVYRDGICKLLHLDLFNIYKVFQYEFYFTLQMILYCMY